MGVPAPPPDMPACALDAARCDPQTLSIGFGTGPAHTEDLTGAPDMKRSILTALALAAVASASLAGTAQAGYSTVEQCTALSGTITNTPGLKAKPGAVNAIITGTLAGCSGQNGAQAGTGTFFAQLSSPAASKTVNNEAGTFVINWPAASGLNPTTGVVNLAGPNGAQLVLNGQDRAGAYASGVLSSGLLITGQTLNKNKVVSQSFINTLPLAIKVNFG